METKSHTTRLLRTASMISRDLFMTPYVMTKSLWTGNSIEKGSMFPSRRIAAEARIFRNRFGLVLHSAIQGAIITNTVPPSTTVTVINTVVLSSLLLTTGFRMKRLKQLFFLAPALPVRKRS
jgi:hypothetical protein